MVIKELEFAIEGILFAAGEPMTVKRIASVLETDEFTVDKLCTSLKDYYSYERRGIRLVKLGDSYQMCSAPENAEVIRKAIETRKPPKLSQSALEALTIIAYYQPTTRAYVDQIRGVDSSYTVGLLLQRDLIEECGRLHVPGRPTLFRTTAAFLRTFGLESLDDLPEMPSQAEMQQLTLSVEQAAENGEAEDGATAAMNIEAKSIEA